MAETVFLEFWTRWGAGGTRHLFSPLLVFCLPPQTEKDVAVCAFLMGKLGKRGNNT